jgi:hypothetical protein
MSNKPIRDLRRRMIADMTIRTFITSSSRGFLPWRLSDDEAEMPRLILAGKPDTRPFRAAQS